MFRTFTRNTALITGGLIFLGYCKYHFYYQSFDITIYNYISTSELLLSFLPIIVQYFIPILILIYLAFITHKDRKYIFGGKDYTKRFERRDENRKPLKLLKHILLTRRLKKSIRLKLILRLIFTPPFLALCWLLYGTVLFWYMVSLNYTWSSGGEGLFYMISIGWLIFILEPFFTKMAKEGYPGKSPQNYIRTIIIFNYFLILTYFIFFSQKISAWKKLNGEVYEKVQVNLKSGEKIITDSTLIYIGQTSGYVFFRNTKDTTNLILQNSLIDKFYKLAKK